VGGSVIARRSGGLIFAVDGFGCEVGGYVVVVAAVDCAVLVAYSDRNHWIMLSAPRKAFLSSPLFFPCQKPNAKKKAEGGKV